METGMETGMDASGTLLSLIDGYQVSQALHVAASLRLSDLVAERPRGVADLAQATGTHAPTLFRLLRALESVGVYASDGQGRFRNTELGDCLRSDVPGSLTGWAEYIGRDYYRQVWGALGDSIRTGANAFATVHGTSPWEYRQRHPAEQEIFDRAMTSTAQAVLDAVVGTYDFGRCATVADIGGGVGTLLAAILQRYPGVKGLVFDQPAVASHAQRILDSAGLTGRFDVVAGDFFDWVPPGADAYVLKSIIHDWLDPEAIAVLGSCRAAMRSDSRLLLVEQLVGRGPNPARTAFSDLNMLVSPGGLERSLEQYDTLLSAAGFSITGVTETGTQAFVIEAEPARGAERIDERPSGQPV